MEQGGAEQNENPRGELSTPRQYKSTWNENNKAFSFVLLVPYSNTRSVGARTVSTVVRSYVVYQYREPK